MIVDQLQGLQEYSDRIPHIKAALETFNGLAQKAIGRYDFEGGYFLDGPIQTIVKLYPGQACVVFPEDAHKPARHLGQASTYKKLVIKLPVA